MTPIAYLRQRFLLSILVLALIGIALTNLMATALRLDYHRPTGGKANVYVYQQARDPADILFLGSSHTREGINANLVSDTLLTAGVPIHGAFNLAQPGANLLVSLITLRDVVASNGCPAAIVIEVDPAAINRGREWGGLLREQVTARDLPLIMPAITSLDRLDDTLSSQLRGMSRLFERVVQPPDPEETERFRASRGSSYRRAPAPDRPAGPLGRWAIRRGRNIYRRQTWKNFEISPLLVRSLEKLLVVAEKCSARVLLVRMPNLGLYSPEDLEAVDRPFSRFMDPFAAEHHLAYADLQWTEMGLDRRNFRNAAHLGRRGAAAVSRHLATVWLAPLLRQPREQVPTR